AEQLLAPLIGADPDILDIQRFGDRLDVLVRRPDEMTVPVEQMVRRAGVHIEELRRDEPLLENTFVARLRGLGSQTTYPPFPGRHDHRALQGHIAIGGTDLVKQFGSFTAVNHVTLQVRYGEVYGLLGANGAGKTTAIRMLCGLLDPTHGEVQLAGERRNVRSPDVRARVGYMSQKFSLYEDLPIQDNLNFFSGVYGVPDAERDEKIRWVLSFAGLTGK